MGQIKWVIKSTKNQERTVSQSKRTIISERRKLRKIKEISGIYKSIGKKKSVVFHQTTRIYISDEWIVRKRGIPDKIIIKKIKKNILNGRKNWRKCGCELRIWRNYPLNKIWKWRIKFLFDYFIIILH